MIPRRRAHARLSELLLLTRSKIGSPPWGEHTIAELEAAMAERVGVEHAVAVGSGRQAMEIIMGELGIGPGDEVIVPAWTLGALVPLIQGLGATVVPADIDPDSFAMDPAAVAARIGPATRMVLALHPFGVPCAIREIAALCREHGLLLLEDCAHALGASLGGQALGSFGDAGFFSFEVTKPLNTYGGGLLVTNDAEVAAAARARQQRGQRGDAMLRSKMISAWTERAMFASNASFPMLYLLASPRWAPRAEALYRRFQAVPDPDQAYLPLQAKLGLDKLAGLDARSEARGRIVRAMGGALHPSIRLQQVPADATCTWYFLVVRLPVPAAPVRRRLLLAGVDAGVGAEIADDVAAMLGYDDCPQVAALHEHALVLPLYDDMPTGAWDRVVRELNRAIGGSA